MDRPSPAETLSRRSVSSELTLYQARGGGPAIPDRDSLSEVGPPASLRHIKQGAVGPPRPSGGPHNIGYLRGLQPDHWPPPCLRVFRGGVTAGLSPRKVRVYHRALGVAGLPCLGAAQHPPAKRGKADQPTSSIANLPDRTIKTPPPTTE